MDKKYRVKPWMIISGLCALLLITLIALGRWTVNAMNSAHYTPDYAMEDIGVLLSKEELTDADMDVISRQTGLSRQGVEAVLRDDGQELLLRLQQRYFAPAFYTVQKPNRILYVEKMKERDDPAPFVTGVREGDILLSFSSHVFGWRCGHAEIVTDANTGQTLGSVTFKKPSCLREVEHWREYPNFALLRLKGASKEECAQIAAFAAENLDGIPYGSTVICGRENGRTQCAHLVWYAFNNFGYDLNSDGGPVVTPDDIFKSGLLEVIQVYGMPPDAVLSDDPSGRIKYR